MSEPAAEAQGPQLQSLIGKYIKLRDKKAQLASDFKGTVGQIDDVLKTVEAAILVEFGRIGVDSVGTPFGTAYKTTKTSATVGDWDALLNFIQDQEAWHLLNKAVNKTAVQEYREQHNDIPPGVAWGEEIVVQVRRS
jgi:hypothetical protein